MLPRYLNDVTSSRRVPLRVTGVVSFRILVFLTCILSLTVAEIVFRRLVFSCTWARVLESVAESSATSKLSCGAHTVPFFLVLSDLRMIQLIASRNRNGERRHSCHTPVSTLKVSEREPPWTTLHSMSQYICRIRVISCSGTPYGV